MSVYGKRCKLVSELVSEMLFLSGFRADSGDLLEIMSIHCSGISRIYCPKSAILSSFWAFRIDFGLIPTQDISEVSSRI